MSAAIHFELNGKQYVYRGDFPKAVEELLGDAMMRIIEAGTQRPVPVSGDELVPMIHIIEEAGGRVTKVVGVRPDGSIMPEDLRDYRIH